MTRPKNRASSSSFAFGKLERREVGRLQWWPNYWMRIGTDSATGTASVSANALPWLQDERDLKRVQHTEDLIAKRVYGLVQAFDLNDHEQLRFDPMFGLAVGKLESQHVRQCPRQAHFESVKMSSCRDLAQEQESA